MASTPYRDSIAARLGPLRDFLLLFFFIGLGARLEIGLLGDHLLAAAIFSVFVLVGNPLIVMAIMGAMGFRKRTGFLAGLTVSQISEFSLIFVAMGVSLGHVTAGALGLVTLVGLITIAVSTCMITYSHQLYAWFEPLLTPFERKEVYRDPDLEKRPALAETGAIKLGSGKPGSPRSPRRERAAETAPLPKRRLCLLPVQFGATTLVFMGQVPKLVSDDTWRGRSIGERAAAIDAACRGAMQLLHNAADRDDRRASHRSLAQIDPPALAAIGSSMT